MRKKQQGLTVIGWLGALSVGIFFVAFFLSVIPAYFDGSAAKSVIEDLEKDPNVGTMTVIDIRKSVSKRLNVNGINLDLREALKVKRLNKGERLVTLDFEIRKSFLFNIDLILTFSAEARIKGGSS